MIDFRWQSNGGILLDGTGDIALSSVDGVESLHDMVRTRLKAAVRGWRQYEIGAGLESFIGQTMNPELELEIKRQVSRALTKEFLKKGTFQIEVLSFPGQIHVLVYVNYLLVAQAVLQENGHFQVS